MRFLAFAEALDRIEQATGRRLVVSIVAELLRQAGGRSVTPAIYLLQGRLAPASEGVELGVAGRLLERVLARSSGAEPAAIAHAYRRAGDLGLVAERLAPGVRGRPLSVSEVHRGLLAVARLAGPGAVERKIVRLVGLLRRATPLEARYLVRIVQGRLRLGVGDQTLVEAIAVAALGDGRRKGAVEHAYDVRTDLGGVARVAFTGGVRGLARIAPRPGVPVRPALAQRLRSPSEIIARLGRVQAEPKYDGLRLQLHRAGDQVRIFTRRLEDVTGMFPELTGGLRRQLRARRAILEGEAVAYDPGSRAFLPFQVTVTRKRKTGVAAAAARHPLRLFAFDLLYADGRSFLPRPQRERSERLRKLLRAGPDDPIAVTETFTTDRPRALQAYFDRMLRRGLEGIVAKQPDAPYHPGARRFTWVKLKRAYQRRLQDTVDVVVVGYLVGRGKRAALGIGSLLGAVYDPGHDRFRTVAKIGSGASESRWRELRRLLARDARRSKPRRVDSLLTPDVWVEPRYVVEVLTDEITRSPRHTCGKADHGAGYALRFPRLVGGVRSDKGPEEATTEREILELCALQRRRLSGSRAARAAPRPSRPPR